VRSSIAAVLALAVAAGAVAYRDNWFNTEPFTGNSPLPTSYLTTVRIVSIGGAVLFAILGMAAVIGLARAARWALEPRVGADYASVTRYAILLIGTLVVAVGALSVANIQLWQLILPGAITGVLITIAAQQALANLFAGLMLQVARPFTVGERIQVRNGAINGPLRGLVVELSITYVQLLTDDGLVSIPNSQMLAAAVGPIPAASVPASHAGQSAAAAPAGQRGLLAGGSAGGAPEV
jgi:small-conductance mechanosensitive channel